MSDKNLQLATVVAAFLLLFTTGYWLGRAGRPYGMSLMAVHKIVAMGVLIFLGVQAYRVNKLSALGAGLWLAVLLAGLAFVAMIATGGTLSAMAASPTMVGLIHKFAPYVTAVLTLLAFYLLW